MLIIHPNLCHCSLVGSKFQVSLPFEVRGFTRAQIQEVNNHGDQLQVYPTLCEMDMSDSEKLYKIVLNP